jgi:diguanylate cyclase (GGDEF)-like protein
VQHFGDRFGLGTVAVNGLAQDRSGALWIATQTGVFRYDGSRVQQMTETDALVGHYVDDLLVGPDSSLWFKGFLGIAHYADGRFVSLRVPRTVHNVDRSSQAFAIDRAGNAYIALERGIAYIPREPAQPAVVLDSTGGVPGRGAKLVLGPDDAVWFTAGRRLGHFQRASSSFTIDSTMVLPEGPYLGLIFDKAGGLWLRSATHLARIDISRHRVTFDDAGVAPANPGFGKPSLDREGHLLIPSVAGLFWRDGDRWRCISETQGLTGNGIQVALADREGALWLGEFGTGVDRVVGMRNWSAWTTAEGLPSNNTWATARDRFGRLWVATAQGIGVWDPTHRRWLRPRDRAGITDEEVDELAVARDGSIWALAPTAGIVRIDPVTLRMTASRDFEQKPYLYEAVAPDGTIWATTREQLLRFDVRFTTPRPVVVPLPDAMHGQIWYMHFAPNGVLWATGDGTVARFDGEHWRVLTATDGLAGKAVTSIVALDDQEVWIGYNDVEEVTHLRLDSRGAVHADQHPWEQAVVAADSKRRVWLNGRTGLSVVAPDGDVRTLNHSDGLIWDDIGPDGVREEADGSFMIATSRGLARFAPDAELTHPTAPGVAITTVLLGGRERRLGTVSRVPHDAGALDVSYTPLTLDNPDQVECQHRLSPLENGFTLASAREVSYTALPPGHYELVIMCRRESSGWTATPASFRFTVAPAWWDTWVARVVEVAMAWGLIWGLVLLRTRALEKGRRVLEEAVAARNAELVEKNRELREMSLTDPLTRLRNRRYFQETIEGEVALVRRAWSVSAGGVRPEYGGDLLLFMVDIDAFKAVNDVYGHAVGDRLLQAFADRLSRWMRTSDVLIRWGGEEFLMICRGTDRSAGVLLSKRIAEEVCAEPFDLGSGIRLYKTCSVGWAPFPWVGGADDPLTIENVIELADHALYLAKDGGRNQCVGLLPTVAAIRAFAALRMDTLRGYPAELVDVVRTAGPGPMRRVG